MRKFLLFLATVLSLSVAAQERRLYIKPHVNFQFPLVKTVRQDFLPYAKINNNYMKAVIMPGIRMEYVKPNGNGYFFNFSVLPLGFAVNHKDYATIDPLYRQRAPNPYYAGSMKSGSSDTWAFDLGFLNRLATVALFRKKAMDIKVGYGITAASFRPYGTGILTVIRVNSMGKEYIIVDTDYPSFDRNKGKWGVMVPFKLDFNIKSKSRNVEHFNFELAYWHGISRASEFNIAYHNITDNITYDNVVTSKGST
jgi:hypothetical protein